MKLIKSPSLILGRLHIYLCILLVFRTCQVSSQSYNTHKLNKVTLEVEELNVPETPLSSEDSSDTDGISLDNHDAQIGKSEFFETGIDFISPDFENLELDEDFFFGDGPISEKLQSSDITPLEFVRMFIRNVKGFERHLKTDSLIASGRNMKLKPAWCFHPFLLKDLVKIELKIYKILNQCYLEQLQGEYLFEALESYLLDIENSSLKAKRLVEASNEGSNNPEDPYLYIATHPLLMYRLIRRFAEDLQPILMELEPEFDDLIDSLYENGNPDLVVFPTLEDLNDSLEAIARIQDGHDLKTYEFGRGILDNVDTRIHLNALHALEVGAYYLETNDFDWAIEWFHFALETVKKSPVINSYPEIEQFFQEMLEAAVEQHNKNFKKHFMDYWDHGVFNATVITPFEPNSYIRRTEQLKHLASRSRNKTEWNWAIKANFKRVCSGENLKTDAESSMLKCWYQRPQNPYWLINPLKTEQLNLAPPVFQIYDFLGDKLIEEIKNSAVSKLQRSTVVDTTSPTESKIDPTRTSSQTWMYEIEHDRFLAPMSRRLELMSGLVILRPLSSDAYQVASYGPSHHYDTHIDSFEDPRRCVEKGNRITTFMAYLNDVKVGGRTGFPIAGIAVEPIKGSLVVWDNLFRNGEKRDERTWHGACPVVLGIKWITNKWVYYKENAFTFQCTLNPNE